MALTPYPMLTATLPPTPAEAVLRGVRSARPAARPARSSALMHADAAYLVAASIAGFALKAFGTARLAGVGFGEAHELALVAGLLLWHASSRRCWHLAAAAVHALLAAANVAHWGALVAAVSPAVAVIVTAMHAGFVAAQLRAASRAGLDGAVRRTGRA
jgi:hypothetical protein